MLGAVSMAEENISLTILPGGIINIPEPLLRQASIRKEGYVDISIENGRIVIVPHEKELENPESK